LAILCAITEADLKESDHFPITIKIRDTLPPPFQFSYKWKLNASQLNSLYYNLITTSDKFEEILKSISYKNLLQKYELFCSFLRDAVSSVLDCLKMNPKSTRPKGRKVPASW